MARARTLLALALLMAALVLAPGEASAAPVSASFKGSGYLCPITSRTPYEKPYYFWWSNSDASWRLTYPTRQLTVYAKPHHAAGWHWISVYRDGHWSAYHQTPTRFLDTSQLSCTVSWLALAIVK
jgi:hypothetical protein